MTPAAHPPKQTCGEAVDVEVRQTPQTPLWQLDTVVTLNPAQIACPATVTVASGLLSRSASACGRGASAPAALGVRLPVFGPLGAALQPGARNPFTVSVTDAHGTDILAKDLSVPPAPAWYGLGDSYSSAFRTLGDQNNKAFSWISRAVDVLNSGYDVPPEWRMTPVIVAASGATTDAMAADRLTTAAQELGQRLGSWNIASVTGGANDADFAGPAFIQYETDVFAGQLPALNDITNRSQCPDKPADRQPRDRGDHQYPERRPRSGRPECQRRPRAEPAGRVRAVPRRRGPDQRRRTGSAYDLRLSAPHRRGAAEDRAVDGQRDRASQLLASFPVSGNDRR